MAKQKKQTQPSKYHIIIIGVSTDNLYQLIAAFAKSFVLEREVAKEILKNAPVIFLSNVKPAQLNKFESYLKRLAKLGLEYTVKPRFFGKLPRVVWPAKSEPGSKIVQQVDFQKQENTFICPRCKELFMLPFAQKEKDAVALSVTQHEIPGSEDAPVLEIAPIKDESEEEAVEEVAETIVAKPEPSAEEQPEETVVQLAPVSAAEEETQPPEVSGEASEIMELKPVEIAEEPESAAPGEGEMEPIDILQPAAKSELEPTTQAQPLEPTSEPLSEPEEEPAAVTNNCSLFLSKISSDEKKEAAAKLIAEMKDIPIEKARDMTKRVLIPVLKDVTEEEAEKSFEKFKELGLAGRITRKST